MSGRLKWVKRSLTLWEYVRGDEVLGTVRVNLSCCGGAKVDVDAGGVRMRAEVSSVLVGKRLVGVVVAGIVEEESEKVERVNEKAVADHVKLFGTMPGFRGKKE